MCIYIYNNGIYIYIYVYETLSLHPSSSNHFPMLLYEFDNSQDVLQGLQRRTTGVATKNLTADVRGYIHRMPSLWPSN